MPNTLSKLTRIELLPESQRILYQREQRQDEKNTFRQQMEAVLGERIVKIAKDLMNHGIFTIRDFVEPAIFQLFIEAYDNKILNSSGSAKSEAFGFTFHNFQADIDFFTDPTFKEAFSSPLLIACIAYAMGGPIRLVDVRGKNAEPGMTMVRDNGPHVDDNPFNNEWKLLITWLVEHPSGESQNAGPQGQPFVSAPGTEKLVRRDATEYGANFKNPFELLALLEEQSKTNDIFFIEAKDSRPLTTIFEASHQMHHRKRSPDEAARGCIILAYHLVDEESKPGTYLKVGDETLDPLDRFIMCGDKANMSLVEINNHFISLMHHKKEEINKKIDDLTSRNANVAITEKMMAPKQLVNYFNLLIDTYKKEYIETNSDLRFTLDELNNPKQAIKKLRERIGEADKHYDLDLIIYPDKREQIRKVPRTALRESSVDGISTTRFEQLTFIGSVQEPFLIDDISTYAKSAMSFAVDLCHGIKASLSQASPEARALLIDLDDNSPHPNVDVRCKALSPAEKECIELYQLTKDLAEALNRCDDVKSLRAHVYFLYLIFDKVINLSAVNQFTLAIEDNAQTILQHYFNLVVKDDLTYRQAIKSIHMEDHEIAEKLSNIVVNDNGEIKKFSDTKYFVKINTQIKLTACSLFYSRNNGVKHGENATIYENSLALAMLNVASQSEKIRSYIGDAALAIKVHVLDILDAAVDRFIGSSHGFHQLDVYIKNSLTYLINEHSSYINQRFGIMRNRPSEEIKSSLALIKEIIAAMKIQLSSINPYSTVDDIDRIIKTINEAAYCYAEYFPLSMKSENYSLIATSVMPSTEELLARIKTEEMLGTRMFSLTTGIDRDDMTPQVAASSSSPAFSSGKSVFMKVDAKMRAQIEYDKLQNAYIAILEAERRLEDSPCDDELKCQVNMARQRYDAQQAYIATNNIRLPDDTELTMLERLRDTHVLNAGLIAGVSNTMARTLITLYDLGIFGTDTFDFDKEHVLGNCVMANLTHGGHHSLLESAESHNRLLDIIAIIALEQGCLQIIPECEHRQFPTKELSAEDYLGFFHADYREEVAHRANALRGEPTLAPMQRSTARL